jgi:hypothetical protein
MIAALSASHLVALVLPSNLRRLYVAHDNDRAGSHAAGILIQVAGRVGVEPIAFSPHLDDFSDDLRHIGPTALAAGMRGRLAPEDAPHLLATGVS